MKYVNKERRYLLVKNLLCQAKKQLYNQRLAQCGGLMERYGSQIQHQNTLKIEKIDQNKQMLQERNQILVKIDENSAQRKTFKMKFEGLGRADERERIEKRSSVKKLHQMQ